MRWSASQFRAHTQQTWRHGATVARSRMAEYLVSSVSLAKLFGLRNAYYRTVSTVYFTQILIGRLPRC